MGQVQQMEEAVSGCPDLELANPSASKLSSLNDIHSPIANNRLAAGHHAAQEASSTYLRLPSSVL